MNLLKFFKKNIKKMLGKIYYQKLIFQVNKNKPLYDKYKALMFISAYSPQKFVEIKKYNDKKIVEMLRKKSKINVGFVTYTSATWNVDQLCRMMGESERFNVDIIIGHRQSEKKFTNKEYEDTVSYFSNLGYSVIEAKDIKNINKYDVLFFLDPTDLFEKKVKLFNLPLNIMVLHTSYSFMLSGNTEKVGMFMYHFAFKYYTDTAFYKKQIEDHKYFTNNVEFLGFPKMDQFYVANSLEKSDKKIIIYAPHHSVNYDKYKSATFEKNYLLMLELAKKYKDDIYWIYKPHPLLRESSVDAGIFKNVEEYDKYEEKWRQLPNAEVMTIGDYFPVFKASDAMITDSVSFLAEYQFTHKPLLLLQSGSQEYNDFGKSIVNILYTCPGSDEKSIEQFIADCIVGNDNMYGQRMRFFEKNLDYLKDGETANEKIFNQISDLLK